MSQYNDQEGSTFYDCSKINIPNTPSLTIRGDLYVEATRVHLEVCNRINDPAITISRRKNTPGQVASGDGTAIHAEGNKEVIILLRRGWMKPRIPKWMKKLISP